MLRRDLPLLNPLYIAKLFSSAILGGAIGFIAFGHQSAELLALTLLIPITWLLLNDRRLASVLVLVYYLMAARGIPIGAAIFFGAEANLMCGVLLWLLASFMLTAPWACFYPHSASTDRGLCHTYLHNLSRLTLVMLSITLPPIGIAGWASPLLSLGTLAPGSGWWGIASFLLLIPLIPCLLIKFKEVVSISVCSILVVLLTVFLHTNISVPSGWVGLDTKFGGIASGSMAYKEAILRSAALFGQVTAQPNDTKYILLPETITGAWFKATEELWQPVDEYLCIKRQTVVIGAEIYDADFRYDNALIFLGADRGHIYRQRLPVPVSMWIPFGGINTAKSHMFDKGIITLSTGERVTCLLCYEQFIAWPFLLSMFTSDRPSILIAAANLW